MVRQKKSRKLNIPMCMALVLFSLTMLSVYLTSGLYAKYVTRSEHDEKAITIGFGQLTLTESGDFNKDGKLVVLPGATATKNAVLSFTGSESATYVFVEVNLDDNWTYDKSSKTFTSTIDGIQFMSWSVDSSSVDGWSTDGSWKYLDESENPYVFYLEVAPNASFTDKQVIKDGQIVFGENITKELINKVSTISIKFRGIAVQSDGFASVGSAWDAVSNWTP